MAAVNSRLTAVACAIVRSVPVACGSATPRALEPRPVDLLGARIQAISGESPTIGETLAATYTDAFLLFHDGTLALEWYAAPENAWTPHPLHSITKSMVGCLAGILIDKGRLAPEARAARYVPALAQGGYAEVLIRDLLDMRTGGDYAEMHDDPDGELAVMGEIVGWREPTGRALTQSLRDYIAHAPRVAVSKGPFSYRSLDTEVLGWVIEEIAGIPLTELLARWLLSPLGAEADGTMSVDEVGDPLASGGLSLVPRDVIRFGRMLLEGGNVGDRSVVPTPFLKDTRMGQADSVAAFAARVGERLGQDAPYSTQGIYRNQFWIPRQGGRKILCLGVHGQTLLVDSDNAVVGLKLSNWPTPQSPQLFTDGLTCLTVAAGLLSGRSDQVSVLQ